MAGTTIDGNVGGGKKGHSLPRFSLMRPRRRDPFRQNERKHPSRHPPPSFPPVAPNRGMARCAKGRSLHLGTAGAREWGAQLLISPRKEGHRGKRGRSGGNPVPSHTGNKNVYRKCRLVFGAKKRDGSRSRPLGIDASDTSGWRRAADIDFDASFLFCGLQHLHKPETALGY